MKKNSAFSLIELSVVILIIGILVAGVTQGSRLITSFRLQTAQNLTQGSPVTSISNLILWYETSMESSFDASEQENNSPVSTWYDSNSQLLAKNNATQATLANKPLFIKNVFNGGIPAIRFDGSSDLMSFDGTEIAKNNYSVFIVEQRRASGAGTALPLIGGTTATQHNNFHIIYDNNTTFRVGHFSYDNNYIITSYSVPIPRIHTATFSTTAGQKYWLNGGLNVDASQSGNTTALVSNAGAAIGRLFNGTSTLYYNGDIAEIIIFTKALKTEERQSIEAYLSKKYNIAIS